MNATKEAPVEDLPAYVKSNVMVPVHIQALSLGRDAASMDILATLAANRKPTDAAVIALVDLPGAGFLTVDPDRHVALVNVRALDLKAAPKPAIRLGQQTLRGLAAAMGVGFQYDPHCVMQPIRDAADLDKMGGNFCPPALQQLLMALSSQGVVPLQSRARKTAPPKK